MKETIPMIVCPICGTQYMMSEIYLPNSLVGKQTNIERTPNGKIDCYLGADPDLDEKYICDCCGTPLKIHANVSFTVEKDEERTVDEEYVSTFEKPEKIELEESLF